VRLHGSYFHYFHNERMIGIMQLCNLGSEWKLTLPHLHEFEADFVWKYDVRLKSSVHEMESGYGVDAKMGLLCGMIS